MDKKGLCLIDPKALGMLSWHISILGKILQNKEKSLCFRRSAFIARGEPTSLLCPALSTFKIYSLSSYFYMSESTGLLICGIQSAKPISVVGALYVRVEWLVEPLGHLRGSNASIIAYVQVAIASSTTWKP